MFFVIPLELSCQGKWDECSLEGRESLKTEGLAVQAPLHLGQSWAKHSSSTASYEFEWILGGGRRGCWHNLADML